MVLEEYLKAWFPILSTWNDRITFIDGFAGPGRYSEGEEGSPLIAIRTAINHSQRSRFKKIFFAFIEKNPVRAKILKQTIKERFPTLPSYIRFEIYNSEFENVLGPILSYMDRENLKLAPTLAFIDPFGFKGFSMNVVSKLLLNPKTEVLITFMDGYIKRFIDEKRSGVLNELFGCNEWRNASSVSRNKEQFLLDIYTKQLHKIVGDVYTKTFGMKDHNDRHIYNLLFATKNLKGLKVMKETMFKIDRRGAYKFSDKTHPYQKFLIDYVTKENSWIAKAADLVFDEFRKNTVDLDKIEEFVISKTPYVFRKDILKHLERSKPVKILNVHNRSRTVTYPDNCSITFAS